MKKGNVNNDKFKVSKLVIIGTFFLFLLLIGRLCYLCLVDYKVGNSTIAAFIKNRNTKELFVKFATGLEEVAQIEQAPYLDGRNMFMTLGPKLQKKKN